MTLWNKARGVLGRVAGTIKKGAKWLWKNKDKIKEVSEIGANLVGGQAGTDIKNLTNTAYQRGTDIGNKINQMREVINA